MREIQSELENEIYREHILDHYRNPRHKGTLADCSFRQRQLNPLCGDVLEYFVKVNGAGKIEQISFTGVGCAISQASASLLAERVAGCPLAAAEAMGREEMLNLLGIPVSVPRTNCALLSLATLQGGIAKYRELHD
ncbi:MAG: iron-sulfur cluster assembly scaffold protein [Parcubacteria group bacterium]|nr:iron-sulfur cluster assembly scaffold protein [Parcubacteria group bacterium]